MAIHFISGKPGGGKSLLGTAWVIDELVFGTRHIVTNLALNVGRLNEYYQETYDNPANLYRWRVPWWLNWLFWFLPDFIALQLVPLSLCEAEERIKKPKQDDICSRVHIIKDEQLPDFFTHRPGCNVESITNEEWKAGKRPDYSKITDAGVYFCLDEVHIPFSARAWALTGAQVLFYLSQHRKLGDEVICITQAVANVDKQFRSVAQDFTYVRNLSKERVGLFRLPLRFVRKTYAQPPSGDQSQPMHMAIYSLDVKGIASCYDTAKGVGIHGQAGADTRERKSGYHWAWFAVGAPLLVILAFHFFPSMFVGLTNHNTRKEQAALQSKLPSNATSHIPAPVNLLATAVSHSIEDPDRNENQRMPEPYTNPVVTCSGWCQVGHQYVAFLTDGETYSTADKEIDWIQKRRISILGKVYDIKAKPAQTEYVSPAPSETQFPAALVRPVNDAQVTVIGRRSQKSALMIDSPTGQGGQTSTLGFAR